MIANSQCAQRLQHGMVESTRFGSAARQLLAFFIAHSCPLPHAPCAVVLHILQLRSTCITSDTN